MESITQQTKQNITPFICDHCDEYYYDLTTWDIHQQTNGHDISFRCPSCSVSFFSLDQFSNHVCFYDDVIYDAEGNLVGQKAFEAPQAKLLYSQVGFSCSNGIVRYEDESINAIPTCDFSFLERVNRRWSRIGCLRSGPLLGCWDIMPREERRSKWPALDRIVQYKKKEKKRKKRKSLKPYACKDLASSQKEIRKGKRKVLEPYVCHSVQPHQKTERKQVRLQHLRQKRRWFAQYKPFPARATSKKQVKQRIPACYKGISNKDRGYLYLSEKDFLDYYPNLCGSIMDAHKISEGKQLRRAGNIAHLMAKTGESLNDCKAGLRSYLIYMELKKFSLMRNMRQNLIQGKTNLLRQALLRSSLEQTSEVPQEQMATKETVEMTSHGEEEITIQKKGNVILTSQRVDSAPTPPIEIKRGFLGPSSATERQNLEQLTIRWLEAAHYNWKSDQLRGSEIDKALPLVLPFAALKNNQNSPNIAPFNIHEYARFDMNIRVQVNSNKFQTGMLQVSWFYGKSLNDRFSIYDNIYSASQRIHGLVSAGSSNDVVIKVPYWNLVSSMHLKKADGPSDILQCLDVGSLSIKVLNPLRVTDKSTISVGVTVWVSFENIEFRAMKASNLDKPYEQMDVVEQIISSGVSAVKIAEKAYSQLTSKENCDKPPVSEIPIVIQPTASHSLCVTDGQFESVEILRSNPGNQTPSVPGSVNNDVTLKSLIRKWSLVETIQWDTSKKRLHKLVTHFSSPASIVETKTSTVGNVKLRYPTLLSYITQFFGFWRGEIELRFDFVANQFYSGRVGVFSVPSTLYEVSYEDARQSAGAAFDLQEGHQFIYKIPYYNNVPFQRTFLEDGITELSQTIMYVINPLSCPDTVSNTIDINIYIRGGENFELAVLRPPELNPFFNTKVLLTDLIGTSVNWDWSQIYTTKSNLITYNSKSYLTMYYNSNTHNFTRFDNLDFNVVYSVPVYRQTNEGKYQILGINYVKGSVEEQKTVSYVTHIVRCQQVPYWPVVVCFASKEKAQAYVTAKGAVEALVNAIEYQADGMWAKTKVVDTVAEAILPNLLTDYKQWQDITSNDLVKFKFPNVVVSSISDSFEILSYEQMDEREIIEMPSVSLAKPSQPTNMGAEVFGERIDDVKSICRRYHYLGCTVVKTQDKTNCLADTSPSLIISTHPVRRYEISKASDRDNFVREGRINAICSMYAGYRGSMRYKLILSDWQTETSMSAVVVHKFDKPYDGHQESVRKAPSDFRDFRTILDTTYASKIQCTIVNSVIEFEIPFYSTSEYNLLYPAVQTNPRLTQNFVAPGQIWVYLSTVKQISLAVDVLYSIGDDFEFSCFQGVPQCIGLNPVGQGDETEVIDNGFFDSVVSGVNKVKETVSNTINLPNNVSEAASSIKNVSGSISALCEKTTDFFSSFSTNIKENLTKLVEFLPKCDSIGSLVSFMTVLGGSFCMIFIQLLYVIISPSISTIVIALSAILTHMVGYFKIPKDILNKLTSCVTSFLTSWMGSSRVQQTDETSEFPCKLASILWAIVCGSLDLGSKISKLSKPNFLDISQGLFKTSTEVFRNHTFGYRFFTDFFSLFERLFQWVNRKLSNEYPIFNAIKEDQIKEWLIESTAILDKANLKEFEKNRSWEVKLFQLQAQGSVINVLAQNSSSALSVPSLQFIKNTCKQLDDKVAEIKQTNSYAPFRREPFVIWLYSDKGGLGKSTTSAEVVLELAKKFKLDPASYTLTSGQKYFDALTTEKFVILDDFLATSTVDTGELLCQFLQIVGTSRLQLPRAQIEKKMTFDDFEFVIVTSNFKDFQVENAARNKSAFDRRRHVIVEFSGDSLHNVSYSLSSLYEDAGTGMVKLKGKQDMLEKIIYYAEKHRAKKEILYQKQLTDYYEILQENNIGIDIDSYISEFKKKLLVRSESVFDVDWVADWFSSLFKIEDQEEDAREDQGNPTEEEDIYNYTHLYESFKNLDLDDDVAKAMAAGCLEEKKKLDEFMMPTIPEEKPENTYTLEEVLAMDFTTFAPPEDNVFEPHPYFCEENCYNSCYKHYKNFKYGFFSENTSCQCAQMDCPMLYRFNMGKLMVYLGNLVKEKKITPEVKSYVLQKAPFGVYIDCTKTPMLVNWVDCPDKYLYRHINQKKIDIEKIPNNVNFFKRLDKAREVHERVDNKCWHIISNQLGSDNYVVSDLRKCLPSSFKQKIDELDSVNGWKLYINSDLKSTIASRIKQFFGIWPKLVKVGNVFHPFPKNGDTSIFKQSLNPSFAERFKLIIGAKPVESEDGTTWVYPKWCLILAILSNCIALCLGFKFIISIVSKIVNMFRGVNQVQSLTSGAISTGRSASNIATAARTLLIPSPQQSGELTAEDLVAISKLALINGKPISGRLKKVLNNTVFLVARTSYDDYNTLVTHRGLGIYNHTVAICEHYLHHFRKLKQERGEKVHFFVVRVMERQGKCVPISCEFDLDSVELQTFGKDGKKIGDMCLANFGILTSTFSDIRKFMPKEGISRYPKNTVLLTNNMSSMLSVNNVHCDYSNDLLLINNLDEDVSKQWYIGQRLVYNCGGPGMCGSIIWHEESQYPLLAFHTSGISTRVGYGELFIQEEMFPLEKAIETPEANMNIDEQMDSLQGCFELVGHLDVQMKPYIPRKTKIIPSLAYSLFETHTEPAPMSKDDPRLKEKKDPLIVGLEKRGRPMLSFKKDYLEAAEMDISSKFCCISPVVPMRKLSVLEAINGLPDVPKSKPIEMKTSEGYPWIKFRPKGFTNKRWLFEFKDTDDDHIEVTKIDEFLERVLEVKSKLRRKGVVPTTYYTAMLKDARIKKENVGKEGKTRVFEMSPIELTIVQRQYQYIFNLSFMNNCFAFENTVGININSFEWCELADRLVTFSPHILAGDYSSYGPTLDKNTLYAALRIIQQYCYRFGKELDCYGWPIPDASLFTNEDKDEYDVLIHEIMNSPVVVDRYVVRPQGGMASGNASTVIINSIVNSLFMRCIFLELAEQQDSQYHNLMSFNRLVRMYSNGDDVIMAVKPEIISWFNNITISRQFEKHHMKYSNSKKDGSNPPYETIFEVSYLKAHFRRHPWRQGAWLAALDKESIEDCCQWIWKGEIDAMDATITNIDQALRLAYGHGPKYFNWLRDKFHCWSMQNYVNLNLPTWKELDEIVWSGGEIIYSEWRM